MCKWFCVCVHICVSGPQDRTLEAISRRQCSEMELRSLSDVCVGVCVWVCVCLVQVSMCLRIQYMHVLCLRGCVYICMRCVCVCVCRVHRRVSVLERITVCWCLRACVCVCARHARAKRGCVCVCWHACAFVHVIKVPLAPVCVCPRGPPRISERWRERIPAGLVLCTRDIQSRSFPVLRHRFPHRSLTSTWSAVHTS